MLVKKSPENDYHRLVFGNTLHVTSNTRNLFWSLQKLVPKEKK